jgi:large subunit ribosomal protein L25
MTNKINLNVKKREIFGKKVKKLREKNIIPANIYGSKIKSIAIQIDQNDFEKTYKEAGETNIVYLKVDEKKEKPTLIVGVQLDPVTQKILHIDFRQIDLTQKVTAQIDLELVGKSPAEQEGLVIVTLKDSVEVEALPTNLPEKIEVDIKNLEKIGDTITIADLKVDKTKVEILLDKKEIVVQAEEKQKEIIEEKPVVEEEDAETEEESTETEEGSAKTEKEGDKASENKKVEETKEGKKN